jgi:hypothetical protein
LYFLFVGTTLCSFEQLLQTLGTKLPSEENRGGNQKKNVRTQGHIDEAGRGRSSAYFKRPISSIIA